MEAAKFNCLECPLVDCPGLSAPSKKQREFLQGVKRGEATFAADETVLQQGQESTRVFTLLEGILVRYRKIEDGERQIVNIMFPGDLVGLQAAVHEPQSHSVEALTPARLCVFPRDEMTGIIREHPGLGYDIVWLAAKEEMALEEHLVALGKRSAKQRIAYLAVYLLQRAIDTGLARDTDTAIDIPITQTQVADMLGLSIVHTNRTLQTLRKAGLVSWQKSEIRIEDLDAAREYARFSLRKESRRPYL